MNIRDELLAGHSKEQALRIAAFAVSSPKNFKALMQCFVEDDYRIAQRAAWSVAWAAKKKPAMIAPYVAELVKQMQRSDVHNAVVRNSVRILESIDVPVKFHGEIMHACFGFIETPTTPIAVKAFALTTLFNLSKKYPEIRSELQLIIEERWDTETAAFRSRGKKILAAFGR